MYRNVEPIKRSQNGRSWEEEFDDTEWQVPKRRKGKLDYKMALKAGFDGAAPAHGDRRSAMRAAPDGR